MSKELAEIAEFWEKIKRNPKRFFHSDDELTYYQIANFAVAYLKGLEYVSGILYNSKMDYWFDAKFNMLSDFAWWTWAKMKCKYDMVKSTKLILREMVLFMKAENRLNWSVPESVMSLNALCSEENLQKTAQKRYDQLIHTLSWIDKNPRTFILYAFKAGEPKLSLDNIPDIHENIFFYISGLLYGMSHFSVCNYLEQYEEWVFTKYSIEDRTMSWQKIYTDILYHSDKRHAARMAVKDLLLFFTEEVKSICGMNLPVFIVTKVEKGMNLPIYIVSTVKK